MRKGWVVEFKDVTVVVEASSAYSAYSRARAALYRAGYRATGAVTRVSECLISDTKD